jgi:hypothetical protein
MRLLLGLQLEQIDYSKKAALFQLPRGFFEISTITDDLLGEVHYSDQIQPKIVRTAASHD